MQITLPTIKTQSANTPVEAQAAFDFSGESARRHSINLELVRRAALRDAHFAAMQAREESARLVGEQRYANKWDQR